MGNTKIRKDLSGNSYATAQGKRAEPEPKNEGVSGKLTKTPAGPTESAQKKFWWETSDQMK